MKCILKKGNYSKSQVISDGKWSFKWYIWYVATMELNFLSRFIYHFSRETYLSQLLVDQPAHPNNE